MDFYKKSLILVGKVCVALLASLLTYLVLLLTKPADISAINSYEIRTLIIVGTIGWYLAIIQAGKSGNEASAAMADATLAEPAATLLTSENDPPLWMIESYSHRMALMLLPVVGVFLIAIIYENFGFDFVRLLTGINLSVDIVFLLGIYLIVLGVFHLLYNAGRTVMIDKGVKQIIIKDSNVLGETDNGIPFDRVATVSVYDYTGGLPKWHDAFYDIVLTMRTGEKVALFHGYNFTGTKSHNVMNERAIKIARYMGVSQT